MAAAAAIGGVGVVAMSAVADDTTSGTQPVAKTLKQIPAVTEVPGAIAERFAVLQQPSSERYSRNGDAHAESILASAGGNTGLARRTGEASAPATWLVPGDQEVCLVAEDIDKRYPGARALTCDTLDRVDRNGLYLATGERAKADVRGIVPDGVDTVTVYFAKGATSQVPVVGNGYRFTTTTEPATRMSWTDTNGETTSVTLGLLP
ncbi:hypothetical protein [Conexibacter sp. CPCC 206217]|uniref:hypothetical protein n=1 Tax=Conexibacter sp. CPCC 206217 TaxID=3064574 RepID=UPI00271DD327|nr:hypothetical protein [Conexibacter sp. CPCC 206217]MDO8210999.1 hypothetical protein [Conexibacter sp. CPCC 206217]